MGESRIPQRVDPVAGTAVRPYIAPRSGLPDTIEVFGEGVRENPSYRKRGPLGLLLQKRFGMSLRAVLLAF